MTPETRDDAPDIPTEPLQPERTFVKGEKGLQLKSDTAIKLLKSNNRFPPAGAEPIRRHTSKRVFTLFPEGTHVEAQSVRDPNERVRLNGSIEIIEGDTPRALHEIEAACRNRFTNALLLADAVVTELWDEAEKMK